MDEQSASRVTDDMVTRSSRALWLEVNPEYQADIRRFTDADIAAGKLREADDAATAANRAIVRRVLEAAFLLLPDDVRELLGEIRVTPDKTGQGRIRATRPDDGTYAVTEVAFPAWKSVTLAEIVAAFKKYPLTEEVADS